MNRQTVIDTIRAHRAEPGTNPMAGNMLPQDALPAAAAEAVAELLADDTVQVVELMTPNPEQPGRYTKTVYLSARPQPVEGVTTEIIDVVITPRAEGGLSVDPVWSNVDRPRTGGWAVTDRRMALRLAAALRAGVVYPDVKVLTDKNGQTYASGSAKVLGRYMNADLRRLGY